MKRSAIEWTDYSGGNLNFVRRGKAGDCEVSCGCRLCYARRLGERFDALPDVTSVYPEKLERLRTQAFPMVDGRRPRCFVSGTGDLFHDAVPAEIVIDAFEIMRERQDVVWQVLTKRPARMHELVYRWMGVKELDRLPANVWLGVSAEDQARWDARVAILRTIPARVRFVSVEPMLGAIDILHCVEPDEDVYMEVDAELDGDYDEEPEEFVEECDLEADWVNCGHELVPNPKHAEWHTWRDQRARALTLAGDVQWVICGGESGPDARPLHPDWVRGLRDVCTARGIAFFFKSWGEWISRGQVSDWVPAKGWRRRAEWAEAVAAAKEWGCLDIGGEFSPLTTTWNQRESAPADEYGITVYRVGRRAAGRLLDGRDWSEYPDA